MLTGATRVIFCVALPTLACVPPALFSVMGSIFELLKLSKTHAAPGTRFYFISSAGRCCAHCSQGNGAGTRAGHLDFRAP